MRAILAVCATSCLCLDCSGQGSGGPIGGGGKMDTGGAAALGGDSASGGNANAGGSVLSGGTASTGGSASTGGAVATGGASSLGGRSSTGAAAGAGGLAAGGGQAGGSAVTAGASGAGATIGSGGAVDAGFGGRTGADAGRGGTTGSDGAVASGGSTSATGGATVTGGTSAGGGTGSDRCDVGVYDSASPPQVLALSGALGCHDPSAIAADNMYYAFCTGLGAETSSNMTAWKSASRPFSAPSWLTSAISGVGDLWAPDISQFGGLYHLYYAGSTFGSNKSCIGHATRASLASGSWTDDGAATICSNVGTSDNWNAIDPNLVIDTDGKLWLTLGSFWSGIKVIQLDDTGKRVGTTVTSIAARPSNGGALEAPFMVRRCGYYYLFMSWDTCCKGADSTYNIRVVRGTSVTGPFADQAGTAALQGGGTLIAQGDSSFAGPGGQSVMLVGNKAYLVYHAYAKPSGAITLRIADLVWDSSGWPVPVGP